MISNTRTNLLSFERARTAREKVRREALVRQAEPIVVDDTHAVRVVAKRKRGRK